jgi:hypothetical protein
VLGFAATTALCPVAAAPAGAGTPATQAPYSDQNAVGYLGLCNQANRQITSGSVSTKPFAWRIVSSIPATGAYAGASRTATVYAYQPRQGLLPSEWSGEAMTAGSMYSNPSAPMAAATTADYSLQQFLLDFPATWNGFVQLRMYLGAADTPELSAQYPALSIQVVGSTWHAVGGGSVSCTSGTAESLETELLPSTTTTAPPAATKGQGSTTTVKGSGSHEATTTSTGGSGEGGSSSGSDLAVVIVIAAAILATLIFIGVTLRRRSGPGGSPPS